jgi:hypothetical protein
MEGPVELEALLPPGSESDPSVLPEVCRFADPHGHPENPQCQTNELWLAPRFRMDVLPQVPSLDPTEAAISPDGWSVGYVFYDPNASGLKDRLIISRFGVLYEVTGLEYEHRPFNGGAWLTNEHFSFDRWSTSQYAMHYVVDVEQKRLVHAAGIHIDWLYWKQFEESMAAIEE